MATLLDLLGLGGSPGDALLSAITGSGAATTQVPPATDPTAAAAAAPPATGSSTSVLPAQAASAPAGGGDPFARLVKLLGGEQQGHAVGKVLQRQGQLMDAPEGGASSSAAKFGGKVLGYGHHDGKGTYAVVVKGGQLYHIYADPKKNLKMDTGGVARTLGIKPKQGAIAAVNPQGGGGGGGAGTTVVGPAGHRIPMMDNHRVPLDPLTGGVLAQTTDGTAQASSPEVAPPVTAATVGTSGAPAVAGTDLQRLEMLRRLGLVH